MTKRASIKKPAIQHADELRNAVVKAKEVHRFKKGEPRAPGAGRKAGTPNRTTALLKDALILAAQQLGEDGKGKGELVGYLKTCAKDEPVAFMRLLEKLLPYQITGKDGSPMQMEHSTKEQLKERLRERGIPYVPSLIDGPAASNAKN